MTVCPGEFRLAAATVSPVSAAASAQARPPAPHRAKNRRHGPLAGGHRLLHRPPARLHRRTASAKLSVPAATCADHSPSECPAAMAGCTPCSASTRQAATLTVMMAGWVFSVSRKSSSGPSKHSFEIANPRPHRPRQTSSAATVKRSASSRPMPTVCEPCPGKRKAILVFIPERIVADRPPMTQGL